MACNCINSILTGCSTEELTELAKILAAQGIGPIATNLAYIAAPANGTITSSTGGPAVVPLATSTNAGLLSPALYTKITAGGGTGTANTLPKFISDSLFGNSHITDDGTLITLTGDVKFQLLQNSAANINIDMPAITNNPPEIGGVPDAVLIRIRGHNGLTASVVSGINCVIEGRRNVGFAVAVATGTTESYAFEATFPTNTTGNYFLKLRNGQVNKFTVTDRGALFAETITYRMGIYYADALDNLKTPGFYWTDDVATGGPNTYLYITVEGSEEDGPGYRQTAADIYPGTNRPPKVWTRVFYGGAWSPWGLISNVSGIENTKIYEGLITQAGLGAPSVGLLSENSLGNIAWSRVGAGDYRGTLTNAFTLVKVIVMITGGQLSGAPGFIYGHRSDNNTVIVRTYNLAGALSDDIIGINGSILIKTVP